MTLGSYVNDQDEVMLAALLNTSYSGATKVAERFRAEVKRADENARQVRELKAEIKGMERVISILAEAK